MTPGKISQLCSEGIQITNVHTALLMYQGLIGKWGMCGVRATLPPSMLFADSVLPCKGYTMSMPKA